MLRSANRLAAAAAIATVATLSTLAMFAPRTANAMEAAAFATLLDQVENAGFSSDKLNTIRSAAGVQTFTCDQVAKLLGALNFSADQMKALELLKTRIEDPDKRDTILEAFTFSTDKARAGKLLEDARPAVAARPTAAGNPLRVNHCGAWSADAMAGLLKKLDDASFSADRMAALRTAIEQPEGFTAAQVCQLLERFSFSTDMVAAVKLIDARLLGLTCADVIKVLERFHSSSDRLAVLDVLVDTITDPESRFTVLPAFTFSSDRERAQKLLDRARPRSHVFGAVREPAVIFILDHSAAMGATVTTSRGEKMTRLDFVRNELRIVIEHQLTEQTAFNIILFNDEVTSWHDGLVPATEANRTAALQMLAGVQASGTPNTFGALQTAFADPKASAIYFLSSGKPACGVVTEGDAIVANVEMWEGERKRTLHTIAFLMGSHDSDDREAAAGLLLRLARKAHGRYVRLEDAGR
ncbi:MAG: DUF4476 domain-containing protein [Planctomycetota bacterium]